MAQNFGESQNLRYSTIKTKESNKQLISQSFESHFRLPGILKDNLNTISIPRLDSNLTA